MAVRIKKWAMRSGAHSRRHRPSPLMKVRIGFERHAGGVAYCKSTRRSSLEDVVEPELSPEFRLVFSFSGRCRVGKEGMRPLGTAISAHLHRGHQFETVEAMSQTLNVQAKRVRQGRQKCFTRTPHDILLLKLGSSEYSSS